MAGGFEIPIKVVIDDGNLSKLESRLESLQEMFRQNPSYKIDTATAQQALRDVETTVKRLSGANIKINLDKNNFKQQLTEIQKMFQQLKAAAVMGLDSKSILGANSRAFESRGIQIDRMTKALSDALARQRNMLSETMRQMSIPKFDMPKNDTEYVITAMQRISDYARTAGLQMQTLGDGSLRFTQSINGIATSVQTFDQNGKKTTQTLQQLGNSFTVAEEAAKAFSNFSGKQKSELFTEMEQQYKKLGVTLKGEDLTKYITSFSTRIDNATGAVKAKVETMVNGVKAAFNFKGTTDGTGNRLLLFEGMDATITNNKQQLQELQSVFKQLTQAYTELYTATSKSDGQSQQVALDRVTQLETERARLEKNLQGYNELGKAVADYNQKMATVSAKFGDAATKSNDMALAKQITEQVDKIKKAYQEVSNLQLKGGNEQQIALLKDQIVQSCDAINQKMGETVIEYQKDMNSFTMYTARPEGIMQTTEQIDKVKNKFTELQNVIDKQSAKTNDIAGMKDLEKLNSQLDQATKKYQEYNNARKMGHEDSATEYLAQAEALEKVAMKTNEAIQNNTKYSQSIKDVANAQTAAFKDNSELNQLATLYDKIIQKTQELNAAKLNNNTSTASGIQAEINALNSETDTLVKNIEARKTALTELQTLQASFKDKMSLVGKQNDIATDLKNIDGVINKYQELFKLQDRIGQLRFKMGTGDEVARLQGEIQTILTSLGQAATTYDKTTNTFTKPLISTNVVTQTKEGADAIRNAVQDINKAMTEGNNKQIDARQTYNAQTLIETYNQIIAKTKELYRAQNSGNTTYANEIQTQVTALKNYASGVASTIKDVQRLKQIQGDFNKEMSLINAKQTDAQSNATLKGYEAQIKQVEQLQAKIEALRAKGTKTETGNQLGVYGQQLEQLTQKLSQFGVSYDKVKQMFTVGDLTKLNTSDLAKSLNMTVTDVDKLIAKLKELQTTEKSMSAKRDDTFNQQAIDSAINKLEELHRKKLELTRAQLNGDSNNTIQQLERDVQRLTQEYEQLNKVKLQGDSTGKTVGESAQAMQRAADATSKYNNELSRTKAAASGAGGGVRTLNGYVENLAGKFVRMASSYLIFMNLQRAIYGSITTVKELDSAMTSLQIVTEKSNTSITNMVHNYSNMAKELGVTLQSVMEGSEEWLRQGFSEAQTEELLRASTMLSTVGNMEAAQATESLTSILNGFNMEASQATMVIDTLNQLDLKYATSAEELATAMQRVSSVAKTAGMDFQELASVITVVSSNTRLSAETIGNGIKSLLSRLQNIKVGKYLDDNNEALNDTEKVLNHLGVTLRTSATEWREPMQILQDVGEMWDNLTDIDKSAIATALGGTYQRNTLMSIFENWNEVGEAMEVAVNSAGSTAQKYEAYMDSFEAKMNQLKTTWSEFLVNLNVSGVASGFISAITGLVSVLDILINKLPVGTMLLTALGLALTHFAAIKLAGLSKGLISIANGINAFRNGGSILGALSRGIFGVGTASTAAAGGVTTLGAALATLAPYIAIIATIGAVIWGVSKAIDAWHNSSVEHMTDEGLQEYIDAAKDGIDETQAAIDGYNQTLDENKQRLEELNTLKGTSNWTPELAQESAELERQNAILEKKIALEERKMEIERMKLSQGANEEFDRTVAEIESSAQGYVSLDQTSIEGDTGFERALNGYNIIIDAHNRAVDEAIQAQEHYLEVCEDGNSTIAEREAAEKEMNTAIEEQAESESLLLEMHEKLHSNYDSLDRDNTRFADQIDDAMNRVALFDESMAGDGIVTFGDKMERNAEAVENIISPVETLQSTIEKLGEDITPVNSEFEDMGEYLRSLDADTVEELQFILDNLGDSADEFVTLLSTMDSNTQIEFISDKFKEFNGIVEDCTAAYDEFKKAVEADYTTEMTGIADMIKYLDSEAENGIVDRTSHAKALEGLGIVNDANWEASLSNYKAGIEDLYNVSEECIVGTVQNINDQQMNISKFAGDLVKSLQNNEKYVDNFDKKIMKVSNMTERELMDAFNQYRTGVEQLPKLNDNQFSALLQDAQKYLEIDLDPPINKLQQAFRDLKNTASDTWSTLKESLSDIDMSKIDIPIGAGRVEFTDSERGRIIEAVNKAVEEINSHLGTSGIELTLPTLNATCTDMELRNGYELVENVQTQVESLFEGNKLNVDVVTSVAESVNDDFGSNAITVDGNKVTFNTDGAAKAFEEALQERFKGINVGSILNAAMNNGDESITFEFGDNVQVKDFSAELKTQIENSVSGMQISMEEVAFNTDGLQANLKAVGTTAETTKTTVVNSIQEAINTINGCSTAACQLSLSNIGTAADDSNGKVVNLRSTIDTLQSKNITITVSYVEKNKPAAVSSGSVTVTKGGGATGFIPGYAVGKRKSDGMTTPMRASEYINAMVGEEGPELKIDKDGQQSMVGMNGPELIHVKPGDTIVPHNVTDMITKGKIEQHSNGLKPIHTKIKTTDYYAQQTGSDSSSSSGGKSSSSSSSKSSGSSSSRSSSGSNSSSNRSSNSSTSNKTDSSSTKEETTNPAAEEALKVLEHRLAMEEITQEEYAKKYEEIWKQYYKDIGQYRDKDWEMQEKVFDMQKEALEKQVDLLEHELTMAEYHNASYEERIGIIKKQQALQHKIAEESRARADGAETDDSRAAAEEWWKLQKDIEDIEEEMMDDYETRMEHQINLLDQQKERVDRTGTELYNKYKDIYNNYTKLVDEATNLGANLNQTIYGNVNLNSAKVLEWTDETIAQYKDALLSWGKDLNAIKGTTSQALGASDMYNDVEISYTAILQTDNGAEVLSKSTVNKYINQLISNAGEGWTADVLLDLDRQGLEVDGKKIQNILVDIGSQADKTARAMEMSGEFGLVAQALKQVQKAADEAGMSVEVLMSKLDVQARKGSNMESVAAQKIAKLKEHQGLLHIDAEKQRAGNNGKDTEKSMEDSDKWWDDQADILDIKEELYDFYIDNKQHEIDQISHHENTEYRQMAILEEMKQKAHQRAEELRAEGYSDESEAIRQLQNDWWDYEEQQRDIEASIHDNFMTDRQHEIDMLATKSGTEQAQLQRYAEMQEEVNNRIMALKRRGYTEESEQIQSLMDEQVSNLEAMEALYEKMYQNQLKRHQHTITEAEREGKSEGTQILELMAMQNLAEAKAQYLRKQGFTETSDEMMELAEEIWGYADQIEDLYNQAFDNQMNEISRSIDELNDKYDRIELEQGGLGETLDDYVKRVNATNKERLETERKILTAYKTQYISIMYEIDRLAAENADANKDRIQQLEDQARSIANTIRQEAEKMKQAALEEQQAIQTHQESIIAGLQSFTQDMIDDLEEQNDLIQEKIDLLEEEMDKEDEMLKEQELKKKLEEATLDLEKKKEALEKTKKNKVKRVFYAERGWVWEADKEAIEDANDALDDSKEAYEDAKKALEDFYKQQQIDAWKKEIEANNKKIESYNDYIQKLSQVSKQYEDHINRMNAAAWLGVTEGKKAYGQLAADTTYAKEVQAIIHKDMEDNLNLTIQNATGYLGQLRDSYVSTAESIKEIELTNIDAWEEALTRALDNVEAQANRAVEMVKKAQEMAKSDYETGKNYNYNTGTYGKPATSTSSNNNSNSSDKYTGPHRVVQVQSNGHAQPGLHKGDIVTTHGGSYVITGVNSDGTYQSEKWDNRASYAPPGSDTSDWYYGRTSSSSSSSSSSSKTSSSSSSSKKSSSSSAISTGAKVGSAVTGGSAIGTVVGGLVGAIGSFLSGSSSKKTSSSSSSSSKTTSSSSSSLTANRNQTYGSSGYTIITRSDGSTYSVPKSKYANGGVVDYTGDAEVHGSDRHSEVVFNAEDAKKLWSMIHTYNPDYALAENTNALYNKMNGVIRGMDNKVHDEGTVINISTVNLPSVQQPNDFVRRLKTVSLNRKG